MPVSSDGEERPVFVANDDDEHDSSADSALADCLSLVSRFASPAALWDVFIQS